MDPSTIGGANMAVVGITTVFVALVLLMAVVTMLASMLASDHGAGAREASAPTPSPGGGGRAEEPERRSQLAQVAAAAFAFHRARRARVPKPAPPSPWLRAGRTFQMHGSRGRG